MDKHEARIQLIGALAELLADPNGEKHDRAAVADLENRPRLYSLSWLKARKVIDAYQHCPRFADARAVENVLREIL